MFKFGVDSFIWTEVFEKKDLWIIEKAKNLGFEVIDIAIAHPESFPLNEVKKVIDETKIEVVTTTTLNQKTNLISSNDNKRRKGIESLKRLVEINYELGSKITAGVNYAGWGCLTGKPRTKDEWKWSVEAMREVAEYSKSLGELIIAVECINRFETHFLNIAKDAVKYCKDVGVDNMKVHLDCFHMIREESSFVDAVKDCGKEYLGYVHVCESNRGIPGTGLVPWKEFFTALKEIEYENPLVIESFNPEFEELNSLCAIWRKFANTGEELAIKGLRNLKRIEGELERREG